MKPLTKSLKDIGFLTIALTLALAANFAYGQFSGPSTAAPGGNVDEPINVGDKSQTKTGYLGVWTLNANELQANTGVNSPQYCDTAGLNCLTHAQLVAAVTGGPAPAPGPADCAAQVRSDTGTYVKEDLPSGVHLQIVNLTDTYKSDGWWDVQPDINVSYQCLDGTWTLS